MKKAIAIFLLLQIGSNNLFAEELFKMPSLFTHYLHHTREHNDAGGFFEYLHNHYADHHQNDGHEKKHDEEDKDCDLPFKHCGTCCLNLHASSVGFAASYLAADCGLSPSDASIFTPEDERIESQNLCSIWQPPKIM